MLPHVKSKNAGDDEDSEWSYNADSPKKITWYHKLLHNRPIKVILILILITIVAPVLIYQYVFFTTLEQPPSDGLSLGSCLISRHTRLPCGNGNVSAAQCHSECCYDHQNHLCFHRFPSRFSYIMKEAWTEEVLLTARTSKVPFKSQRSYKNIRLSIDEISATHLSLTFYKSDELISGRRLEEKDYSYDVGTGANATEELEVVVNTAAGIIFNTARGPLIASDNIWEITFRITDEVMYGLEQIPLRENTTKIIYSHKGGPSSVPLIYARLNGSYHGFLIDTTAPTEIQVRGENQLVVRSITKFGLKFHLFVGPNPVDVMKDVSELIGNNKKLEYWMLGLHICSEPAPDNALVELRNYIAAANSASMPFDSHCGIAPVVFNTECDRTYVNQVNSGTVALRNARKKYVPHVSPYIRYTEPPESEEKEDEEEEFVPILPKFTINNRCFDDKKYKEHIIRGHDSDKPYLGEVDDHNVIYPKYDNVSEEFMKHLWAYNLFDGVVLENNWPLDESDKNANEIYKYLPYFNKDFAKAFKQTPQWNASESGRYFDRHNEYGNEFAMAFGKIVPDVPTMSTSPWMNGNIVVNRQNIETSWSSLRRELLALSLGGISGHWYWSSPICGDTENFNETIHMGICTKWYMAATYFPMIKIHSKEVRRDPLAFVGTDRRRMLTAINRRMRILPYLYTVLQEGPLLRPMFYQYPSIDELANLTTQFSVGDDMLIVPNLQPSQSHIHFRMPPGTWYEFWGGMKIEGEVGQPMTMTSTDADFFTLLRAGSIVLINEEIRLTTEDTRQIAPFVAVIALNCVTKNVTEEVTTEAVTETTTEGHQRENGETDSPSTTEPTTTPIPTITTCSAKGKLYVTPNMTFIFEANPEELRITAEGDDFDSFCDFFSGIMAKEVWDAIVFGLDDDLNTTDNYRKVMTFIDLCDLRYSDEIVHSLL